MRKYAVHLFVPLFLILSAFHSAQAKEYTIPTIRIEATILPDGSVRIVEHRTYVFDDDFSWADYRLPLKGFTAIENITVTENGRSYLNRNDEQPGTFLVNRDNEEIQIKWFYEAENEQRTFTIAYTLKGAIVTGPKWAEFFWNYISAEREKDTESLRIEMKLPAAVTTDSLYVWERGPESKIDLQKTSSGYTLTAKNLDDDESVKIRSVFPTHLLLTTAKTINDDDFSLASARQNEETYQKEQEAIQQRNALYAGYGQKLLIAVSLLSIIAFIFFFRKYGKRHAAGPGIPDETLLIPGRLKPAVAGWLLMKRNVGSAQLMATLLDLARRKYFVIKEQEPEKKWLSGEKKIFTIESSGNSSKDDLTSWESDLHDFVNEQIADDNNRIDKLFSASSYKASKWFSSWKKKLNHSCKAHGWYDQASYTGAYANAAAQLPLLAGSAVATFWAGPIGVIGIAITTICMIASLGIIRRTPGGERTYRQWKAYRKGLKNAPEHAVDRNILDRHFIYAISFGLSKTEIESLFNQCDASTIAFYWFIFHGNSHHSASEIAGTFSTLGASGAAAFPGAAGGAGATAGSAGGGASGGAG